MRQRQLVWVGTGQERGVSGVLIADTWWTRARGLLWRMPLQPGEGLHIKPCNSIHCFFMTSAIDVVFLGVADEILRICPRVSPWRVRWCIKASSVVELAPGEVARLGLKEGDTCVWR